MIAVLFEVEPHPDRQQAYLDAAATRASICRACARVSAVISISAPFISGTLVEQLGYEALFVVALVMVFGALFVSLRYVRK